MVRTTDRIGFQAIAIVLSLAIACYPNWSCAYVVEEPVSAADMAYSGAADGESYALSTDTSPSAFIVLEIQLIGEEGVSLSWSDLGSNFVYTVEFCDSLTEENWAPVPPVEQWPTATTNWTDSSLGGSGTRFYRIQTEALYDAPAPPSDVSATVSGGNLVIDWGPVGGASSYNVYWSTDEKFSKLDANLIEDVAAPFTHSGLTFGVTYYYMVTAVGNKGGSEVSSVVSAALTPALDRTVATTLLAATEFLYTGENPIQTGVGPGTIEAYRVAVLRGKVLNRDGEPLSGVAITVLNHPELGQTVTRDDGMFDMAVNGGGHLTLNYFKEGYLRAQRQVPSPWQDYAWLPDVVLIPRDAQVTTVDLSTASMQVARGSVMTDDDGTRQATLLVPEGTTAELEFADGSTQPITALSVRATEFTVGDSGPKAMPAELPPTTGYTYCVEFSVDEAEAAGAKHVRFDPALPAYVENFLDFPVGGIVPAGYYDADKGAWVPSDNGRIVEVLSVNGGLAELDVDGSGLPADASALADLGITDVEREQLASLYTPGQSLWRVPTSHFSPGWDYNWAWGPALDAFPPDILAWLLDKLNDFLCEKVGLCDQAGSSVMGIQNQTLGESVAIAGTPFHLHYQSDRAPGFKATRTLTIPVSGDSLHEDVKRIDVVIRIAGRRFRESLPAQINQEYSFTWDGKDAYGRDVQGAQLATIWVGYVYQARYLGYATFIRAFARQGNGVSITPNPARMEATMWQKWHDTVHCWDGRTQGLGGWSLDLHHAYDPEGQVLYRGDGTRAGANSIVNTIDTVAGGGTVEFDGSDRVATEAYLEGLPRIAFAPDGSYYITGSRLWGGLCPIYMVGRDGILRHAAGWSCGFAGDGGPATEARLDTPMDVAVGPGGSLYIADTGNHRIRMVDSEGIITTVAGGGTPPDGLGDGGPATEASLNEPMGIAFTPSGSLYIADWGNHRVRHVGPDGTIETVAGTGVAGFSGDGAPATEAEVNEPQGVAVGPDGSLYIADTGNERVRRIGTDGLIETVAGGGTSTPRDGTPATEAKWVMPYQVAVGVDGSIYFRVANWCSKIARVGGDGLIRIVAGPPGFCVLNMDTGDGGPAVSRRTGINAPHGGGLALSPYGDLYIGTKRRVRKVSLPMPGFDKTDLAIPSDDGSELYYFDPYGRHLRTVNTLTGATIYEFTYDDAGLLTELRDGDGNITIFERNAGGMPTAIVASFGQRTELNVNGDGYLDTITDAAGNPYAFTYVNEGLLETATNPRSYTSSYTYDSLGRLIKDEGPDGGFTELERTEGDSSYTVSLTTAEGRTSSYQVEAVSTGEMRHVNTFACCTQNDVLFGADGSTKVAYGDGTVTTEEEGPDPRFGIQAPLMAEMTIDPPGSVGTYELTTQRTATLTDPTDVLSLETLTDTVAINYRTYTNTFHAATRTWTRTSPEGRLMLTTQDGQGRPLEILRAGMEPLSLAYDARGRMEQFSHGTRQRRYAYDDASGYLRSITNPLEQTRTYARDSFGRLTSLTLPDNTTWSYERDEMGNLLVLTEPDGTTEHKFTYTQLNLIESYRSPLGAEERFTYNKDRQLTRRQYPSGNAVDWLYNTQAQLAEIQTPEGNHTFAYDDVSGLLTQAISRDGQQVDYMYDGSFLKRATWGSLVTGSIAYRYNADHRVSRTDYAGLTLDVTYDNDGLLTGVGDISLTRDGENGLLTGVSDGDFHVAYAHSSYGEVSSTTATHGSSLYDVSYTYDALGRVSQKVETIGAETHTWDYEYDSVGQLITVKREGAVVESYAYDGVGNRIGMNNTLTGRNLASEDYGYDADNKLLEAGATTYSYDPDGRLHQVTEGTSTTTYDYNTDGTLASVDLPDGRQITYQHDTRGRRIARSVDGVRTHAWLYGRSLMPAVEYDGSGNVRAVFIRAGNTTPVTMIRDGSTYHMVSDHLGSPRLIVDDTGTAVKQVDYDAFGNVLSDTKLALDIPFGFAAGMSDPDHELIRFGARDYQPATGRWTAKDPILFAGGFNLYGYAGNDPVNKTDRTGQQNLIEFGIIVVLIAISAVFVLSVLAPPRCEPTKKPTRLPTIIDKESLPGRGPEEGYWQTVDTNGREYTFRENSDGTLTLKIYATEVTVTEIPETLEQGNASDG